MCVIYELLYVETKLYFIVILLYSALYQGEELIVQKR